MNVVFYAMGTLGDVEPYIQLANKIKSFRNKIIFISNEIFRNTIQANGFYFHPVTDSELYNNVFSNPRTWSMEGADQHFIDFHLPAFRPSFEFIRDLSGGFEKVFAIYQASLNGVKMACMEYGIPSAQVVLSPSAFHSNISPSYPLCIQVSDSDKHHILPQVSEKLRKQQFDNFVQPHINPIREKLGLNPWAFNDIGEYSKEENVISLFPDWLRPVPDDWPKPNFFAGFPVKSDKVHESETMNAFFNFYKKYGEPIIFTPGTGYGQSDELVQFFQGICEELDLPGVFVGPHVSPILKYKNARFICLDFLQFEAAFKRCRLVVHHGGIGTAVAALQAGIPQIIRPLTFDQPDNAYWLWKLGVANAIDPEEKSISNVIDIFKDILQSSTVKENLGKYRKLVSKTNGSKNAASALSKLISR
jgi:rhamnosyltransferase subunit B